MKLFCKTLNSIVTRSFENNKQEIALPIISILNGELTPNELIEITRSEVEYFSIGEKLTIKILLKNLKAKDSLPSEKESSSPPPSSDEKKGLKNDSKQEIAKNHVDHKTSEEFKNDIDADKATLVKEGDSIEGMFHSFGSRNFGGSNASVIYLYHKNNLMFIRGTDFSEHKSNNIVNSGDIIRVTKTSQYKKAKDKEHAQAARFDIEVLEKNS